MTENGAMEIASLENSTMETNATNNSIFEMVATNDTLFSNINSTTTIDDYDYDYDYDYDSDLRYGFFSKTDDYGVGATFITIAVLGVTFNTLTIFIIALGRKTSKEVKIQILNLAFADLLVAIFYPVFQMIYLLELSYPVYIHSCRLRQFLTRSAIHASPLCNAAISLERVVVVFFPLRASRYTRTHKLLIVALIWILAAAPELESLLYAELGEYNGNLECWIVSPLKQSNPAVYEWMVTLKYVIPASIMVVSYTLVFINLCRQKSSQLQRHSSGRWRNNIDKVCLLYLNALCCCIWFTMTRAISVLQPNASEELLLQ